jgi:N-acetylglucosaminyl-diphospho-decaprenol L-rhamnosyltransferase
MSKEISFNSLTIVIVLYRESFNLILNTLSKIKNFKIIIIDNDNNNDLKKKILSNFKIDQYILNKKNIGFSAGYNQGLKLSTTKFSLVLGPDCIIFEKDIFLLIKKIIKFDNTLIVSPTSYDEKNNLTYAGGPLPENGNKDKVLNISGDVCVDNTLGACMLFRTNDLKEKKLFFDENFFLYFSDDDLCRRVKSMKKSIIQVFDAKCIHQHGNLKVKNIYLKSFIREYNYSFDQLYYYFKIKKHQNLTNSFQKKLPLLISKLFLKLITFQFLDVIKNFSKILAYYQFKRKFLRRDGRAV